MVVVGAEPASSVERVVTWPETAPMLTLQVGYSMGVNLSVGGSWFPEVYCKNGYTGLVIRMFEYSCVFMSFCNFVSFYLTDLYTHCMSWIHMGNEYSDSEYAQYYSLILANLMQYDTRHSSAANPTSN